MGAVKRFEYHGVFWRPAAPTHQVPGTIEMTEDSLDLTVTGNLIPFDAAEVVPGVVLGGGWEWLDEPILYGRLDSGKDVTLLGAGGLIAPTGLPFVHVRESYRVQAVCFGGHAAADAFDAAAFSFDTLEAWAQPPWLVSAAFASEFHVQHQRQVLGSTSWRDLKVSLVANATGSFGRRKVSLERRVALEVAGPECSLETIFNGWIRPFQSLLMVSLGTGCEITDVTVTGADLDGERIPFDVRLRLPAARPGHEKLTADNVLWPEHDTLLTGQDTVVSFAEFVPAWLDLNDARPEVVSLICIPYRAPFLYEAHGYGSTFQAAEALAKQRYGGSELDKQQHKARVARIAQALKAGGASDTDVTYTTNVISGRNDRSLNQLITELLEDAGLPGEQLLALPKLVQNTTRARTGVSHGGADSADLELQFRLRQALQWVVRRHLTCEVGLTDAQVDERVTRAGSWQHTLRSLTALLADEATSAT